MNKKHIYSLAVMLCGLFSLPLCGQELNESLTVEGEYVPVIRHQERINTLPEKLNNKLQQSNLNVASKGVPTEIGDDIYALPVTGWRTTRSVSDNKGYVDFGMGSYLNIVGSAGYRFLDEEKTKAGAWLQHNSSLGYVAKDFDWSGWSGVEGLPDKSKKFRTDTRVTLYGSHDFGVGHLDANLSYRFGRFNYYGVKETYINNFGNIPMQNLNDVGMNIGWQGRKVEKTGLNYNFDFSYRHFGYHRNFNEDKIRKTQKENHFSLGAKLLMPWDNGSFVGLDVLADMVLYTSVEEFGLIDTMNDYGKLTFSPYYRFAKNNLNVHAGLMLDLTFNAKRKYTSLFTDKYALVHIAPQVKLDWKKDLFGLWLHLLGGTELNTLANNSQLDYYQAPQMQGTLPMYSPIDGRFGFRFGKIAGFAAELMFDYKVTKNVLFGGLYMDPNVLSDISFVNKSDAAMNINGWRVGLGLNYEFSNLLTVNAQGYYSPQNAEKGYFNGYDRPRWVIDTKAELRPWSTLKVSLGYQYRGVRNLYDYDIVSAGVDHRPNYRIYAHRLSDIALLNLGASYALLDNRLTIWAQANNLLSSASSLSPALPDEGFNFLIGAGFNF